MRISYYKLLLFLIIKLHAKLIRPLQGSALHFLSCCNPLIIIDIMRAVLSLDN